MAAGLGREYPSSKYSQHWFDSKALDKLPNLLEPRLLHLSHDDNLIKIIYQMKMNLPHQINTKTKWDSLSKDFHTVLHKQEQVMIMATPTLDPGASLIVHDASLQTFSLAYTNRQAATSDLKKRRMLPSLVGFCRTRWRNCGLDIRNYDITPWKVSFFFFPWRRKGWLY